VNYCEDMHQIIPYSKKHAIGKSGQQGTPNTRQNFGVQKRHLLQAFELQLKLRTQSFALRLVPRISLAHFPRGAARKSQAVRHEPFFNLALT
jgi:hypothetical protein